MNATEGIGFCGSNLRMLTSVGNDCIVECVVCGGNKLAGPITDIARTSEFSTEPTLLGDTVRFLTRPDLMVDFKLDSRTGRVVFNPRSAWLIGDVKMTHQNQIYII